LHPSLSDGEDLGRNYRSIPGRVLTPFAFQELEFCGNTGIHVSSRDWPRICSELFKLSRRSRFFGVSLGLKGLLP